MKVWNVICLISIVLFSLIVFPSHTLAVSKFDRLHSYKHYIDGVPIPNIETENILGPAGEIFKFTSCNRGDLGFSLAYGIIPAGAGPLPHVHHYTNEWFWTPEGGIQLLETTQQFPNLNFPPTREEAGNAVIYSLDAEANQVFYGPKYHIHGFINKTEETHPLVFIWIRDESSPEYPLNDGGIREYFQEVGIPIKDLNNLPPITDEAKLKFITSAPKYGINQSAFFTEYIKDLSEDTPVELVKLFDEENLMRIIDAVNAYNQGDKSVSCF
ncbi:cupin domain-containing protein [Geminocystis sp. CENA526]|uniref:cupin domain-containing protein n=1 Tax=Geminocystis sp. CENA526 TaxID=1355871 RepID=UPI003D6FDF06